MWPTLIGALLLRDRGTCAYCNVELGRDFEVDHVRPTPARLRRNDPRNLVCACGDCNRGKGAGPVPAGTLAEVRRRTRRVLDYKAGRVKARELYAWFEERNSRRNAKRRKQYSESDVAFDPAELAAP